MAPNSYEVGQVTGESLITWLLSPKKPAQNITLSKAGMQTLTRTTKIHRVHSTCASPRIKATLLRSSIPLSIPVLTLWWNAFKSDDNLAFLPLETASFQEVQNQNCGLISETTYGTMGYLCSNFPSNRKFFLFLPISLGCHYFTYILLYLIAHL